MHLNFKSLLLVLLLFVQTYLMGQEVAVIDSLKKAFSKAITPEEKVRWYDEISRLMMNVNPNEAEEYGAKLIAFAEETRDRKLMFKAYMSNGTRCSYLASQKSYTDKAKAFYEKGLAIAQENKLDEETAGAQLMLASLYLGLPDNDKAHTMVTQAFSLISTLNNDSLRVRAHIIYGKVYQAKNENILALRNFLSALRISEDGKNTTLVLSAYTNLSDFYSGIEDYDRALDYLMLAYKELDYVKEKNVPYQKVIYLNNIGKLYSAKKNSEIAISYFERSIGMADSLKFSTLKLPGYIGLLNEYLQLNEPQKALIYMNSSRGDDLKKYLSGFNMASVIDQAYGVIYTEIGRFDSAKYFLEKARQGMENSTNDISKIGLYMQLARFYKKSGDKKNAVEFYLKLKEAGEKTGILEFTKEASKQLDSLYSTMKNFPMAMKFNALYYQVKDSIETLKRAKELSQVEAADEQLREIKRQKEADEMKRRRNNIQYLAIVIGIVGLFISLVILGMFKVSAGLIKAIGFFVFLMLFEFIFLLFKKNIYSITHGEPWKDLAFMIALAALLVPLHHWLEHKVLHYLTSHNRLTSAGHQFKNKFLRRTKGPEH